MSLKKNPTTNVQKSRPPDKGEADRVCLPIAAKRPRSCSGSAVMALLSAAAAVR
ncbi:MAG: hypothetical protein ACMG6S_03515 [Byssovorax sp.]